MYVTPSSRRSSSFYEYLKGYILPNLALNPVYLVKSILNLALKPFKIHYFTLKAYLVSYRNQYKINGNLMSYEEWSERNYWIETARQKTIKIKRNK